MSGILSFLLALTDSDWYVYLLAGLELEQTWLVMGYSVCQQPVFNDLTHTAEHVWSIVNFL